MAHRFDRLVHERFGVLRSWRVRLGTDREYAEDEDDDDNNDDDDDDDDDCNKDHINS